jgi:hypothetical protein
MRWDVLPEHLENRVQSSTNSKPIVSVQNKYHNKKTIIDGILFHSKKEAEYYSELIMLRKCGDIASFERQVPFVLQEGYVINGKKIRPIIYIADFVIEYIDGTEEVVDTKGFRTKIYKLKKKILLYKYPNINFKEI